jgi:23S rRNA (uridine2552-2'-O)-methyltransferase
MSARRPTGKTASSTRWLQRQARDPFVAAAEREGYRSRAAYKLAGLDDKLHLLAGARRILDLGAAPGGWSQVAARRARPGARIVAADIQRMDPVPGVEILALDVHAPDAEASLRAALGGPADLVLSDMAPKATGHRATDHLRIMALAEAALDLAAVLLAPGGAFVVKVLEGGDTKAFEGALKRRFARVAREKPKASRAESSEFYFVARDFLG